MTPSGCNFDAHGCRAEKEGAIVTRDPESARIADELYGRATICTADMNAFAEEASSSFASTKERHEKLPREKVVKPLPDRPPFKVPPGPVSAWAAVDVGVRMHYH